MQTKARQQDHQQRWGIPLSTLSPEVGDGCHSADAHAAAGQRPDKQKLVTTAAEYGIEILGPPGIPD